MLGLEDVLAAEVRELGGSFVETGNRVVHTKGDLGFLYKLTFNLRTALRVLRKWQLVKARDADDLYKKLMDLPWEDHIKTHQTFRIDVSGTSDFFPHGQYTLQRVKDALVDRFRDKFGERPSVDARKPDIVFQVHVYNDTASISLDASGFSLHKRSYRVGKHPAPLNEVLAAGIVKLVNWSELGTFMDPMCGSGTILTEAAWNAYNIPPQVLNSKFSFMNWPDYDEELWKKIQEISMNKVKDIHGKFIGFDLNKKAVEVARQCIKEARLNDEIPIYPKNYFDLTAEDSRGVLVFNPPYDERLETWDPEFYKRIGDVLKKQFAGYEAWIFTGNLESAKQIGLRATRRINLQNGSIDCKLLKFELYSGTKKIHKLKDKE